MDAYVFFLSLDITFKERKMIPLQLQDLYDGTNKVQDLKDFQASGKTFSYNGGQTGLARIIGYQPDSGMVDLVEVERTDVRPSSIFYGAKPRGEFSMPAGIVWNSIFY